MAGEGLDIGQAGRSAQAYAGDVRRRYRTPSGARGQTLPSEVRSRLTPHLGFDPEAARLHTGPEAAAASEAIDAEAFTVGRDVFFGEGRYDPSSERGLRLLTHELVHVGQQTRNQQPTSVARAASEPGMESSGGGDEQLHRETHEAAPSARFAMPLAQPSMATAPAPSQTATEEQGAAAGPDRAGKPAGADAHQVADQVYELMKREIALGRERGCIRIRRR